MKFLSARLLHEFQFPPCINSADRIACVKAALRVATNCRIDSVCISGDAGYATAYDSGSNEMGRHRISLLSSVIDYIIDGTDARNATLYVNADIYIARFTSYKYRLAAFSRREIYDALTRHDFRVALADGPLDF